ncbi:MAG: TldD/PmbA family protein, partial [Planctomycetes bacterium]|nr:TldD/PmbA family protein [Planctomycetota bacterium]
FAPAAKASGNEEYDAALAEKDAEYLFDLCDSAKEKLKAKVPEALFSGTASFGKGYSSIVTSEGQSVSERYAQNSLSISAELNAEGDFLATYAGLSKPRVLTEADIDEVVERAASDFLAARKSAEVKEGSYRVLLSPDALSDALTPVTVCANGLNIEKKISRWVDSLGEKVFGDNISIWDDPQTKDGPSTSLYDGEGVPTQRRPIIEKGVLKSFAHSRLTAARCKTDATGNGVRSFASTATPGFHNVVMEGGDVALADLMSEANGGLMIRHLIGVFTSNFLAGQVSGNIMTGFKVEGGELAGRVKNAAINFNLFDVFNGKVLGISKEREWSGDMYLPYILIDAVALSAK